MLQLHVTATCGSQYLCCCFQEWEGSDSESSDSDESEDEEMNGNTNFLVERFY